MKQNTDNTYPFLAGGGEMGKLTRNFNWSQTGLGTPAGWPQSLRTTVGIVLRSKFPMFLWWGPALIQFYNDAYRPGLGNEGMHPQALGNKGIDSWQDKWPAIKPVIDSVLKTGESTWNEDRLIPIYRNGKTENVYWTFSYSVVLDDDGNNAGVLVTCTETNEKANTKQRLTELDKQLYFAIEASELATWELDPDSHKFTASKRLKEWFGLPLDQDFPFTDAVAAIPEKDRKRVSNAIAHAMLWESGGKYEVEHSIINVQTGRERIVRAIGLTTFDEDKKPLHFNGTIQDITDSFIAKQRVEESENKLRSIIAAAPAGIGLLVGRDLVIQNPNQTFIDIVGKGPDIEGLSLSEAMPELLSEGQPFLKILDDIFVTGIPYISSGALVKIVQNGILNENYYNISYTPIYNSEGQIYAILDIAIDVTEQIKAQQKLQESEAFSRAVFYNSPVAKLVYVGHDMVVREANEKMLEMLGRDPSIIGKSIRDTVPELWNTKLLEYYRNVLETGEAHSEWGEYILVVKKGEPYGGYYDYTYKALRDADGKIYGVICTAVEVTSQVIARQKLEETELSMRGAVELAQLGTWSIDAKTNGLTYSDRLIEWFGYDPATQEYNEVIPILREEDQLRVANAVAWALNPESDGVYDEIYMVTHPKTGKKKILHAQGKAIYDKNGVPIRMNGTAQDITIQHELQLALENEVQERTEQLEATNEELLTTNEELFSSNELLRLSNEELSQYAYVASHDLQEPLRKIQVFSNMLINHKTFAEEHKPLVNKIGQSAERMTLLIKDLLNFSSLSKADDIHSVDLNDTLKVISKDFELLITEKNAKLEIVSLPVVEAVPLQMNQLFYNLVSNALKFTKPEVDPLIKIDCKNIHKQELIKYINNIIPEKNYFHILIQDNGIGFDVKHSDKIFEVFKRLHGREAYPGSGIGLALCRRIVDNHGGYLFTESVVGVGTTFHVILHN